jgi:hypothetical protein
MSRRRLGRAAMVSGFVLVFAAQRLAPIAGPPLFDGVIVEAPYRWLSPPAGHSGGAKGITEPVPVQGNQSPDIAVGTNENPPQAQVFAGAGYLNMPPGTTAITVSIQPVQPPAQPPSGVIAGNVYSISLTNQDGQPVTGQASGGVTVELRGPHNLTTVTIERYANGAWTPIGGDSVGQPNMFTAVVTDFGDFAVVAPAGWSPAPDGGGGGGGQVGPVAPAGGNPTPTTQGSGSPAGSSSGDMTPLLVGGGVALVVVAAALGLLWYARREPGYAPRPPSNRQAPRPPVRRRRVEPPPIERRTPSARKRRR